MGPPAPVWNSLEIAKLAASVLTPLAVAVLGLWLNRRLKRLEHLQWANQKAVEKRLEVYSALAPALNDLYCYFDFIGEWKCKEPTEAIALKRTVDRLFYVHAPLFSRSFRVSYDEFIDLCFIPGPQGEYDASARLRADIKIRRELIQKASKAWDPQWDTLFSELHDVAGREEIRASYWKLMDAFTRELGVELGRESDQ